MITVALSPSIDRLMAGLEAAIATQEARMAATAADAADILLGALRGEAPERTGELKANMQPEIEVGNPTTVYVTNETPYRRYVLSGHGDIYPVRARVLRFEVAGGVVFARHVRPVPPNEYPVRARADAIDALTALLEAHAFAIRATILGA